MSHYKPYPAYKVSGVEWLGRVPEHWVACRFSRVIAGIKDGTHGTFERVDDGQPLLSAKNVSDGVLDISSSESQISEADHASIVANGYPQKGDLLLTIVGSIGRACVYPYDYPLSFQRSVCFIRLAPETSPNFFRFFSQSKFFQEQIQSKSKSSAQAGIYMGDVEATSIAFPVCVEEQQAIVNCLSRETARIDALIEKKTRFIELLREKRQALITHAVTKGLDPSVKMKDSGVEWLGEVPEHWVVSRLRHNIDGPLSYGANEAAESDEPNDPRFIRITDLHEDGTLREDTFKSLSWNVAQPYLLSDGDVLLARSGATVGKSFIYRESMGPSCYAGYLIRARLLPSKLISQYFWLCTQSTYYWDFIAGSNIQATIQNVSGEKYANLWLAVPPIKEQQRIINFLEEACDRLDSVRVKTERSIELLKERRSALITAAVTGQIDLREAV